MSGEQRKEPRAGTRSAVSSRWPVRALRGAALVALVSLPPAVCAQSGSEVEAVPADTSAVDSTQAVVQRDLMDILHALLGRREEPAPTPPPRRGISRSVLPSLSYNAVSGVSLGASVALGGWLGEPANTRVSSGIIGANYSTKGQTSIWFKSDFVLPRNSWVLKGDWRFLDTNQPTFTLGPTQPGQSEYPMDFTLYRLHQAASRRIGESPASIGLGYHLDYYSKIRDERAQLGETTPYSEYSGGTPTHSTSSGFSLDLVYDTRDNAINARSGLYWYGSYRMFREGLGSDGNYQVLWSDLRGYRRLPEKSRNVLAVWSYLWFTSETPPYMDLPAIGWDTYGRSGRGYIQGRMRGSHIGYGEVEYRMRLTKDDLLGAVAFGNLTSTRAPGDHSGGPLDFGFGGGLRFKLNKRTDTNISVDLGRGDDGEAHFYVAMQEAY